MLAENIRIVRSEGAYQDFPYNYQLFLYDKCVWTDDFMKPLTDKQVIKEFIKDLKYAMEEL